MNEKSNHISKDIRIYFEPIINSLKRIDECISNVDKRQFLNNQGIQDSVYWNLIIINKNFDRLSLKFKKKYSSINWEFFKKVSSFKINIIQGNQVINFRQMWDVIEENISDLIQQLRVVKERLKEDNEFIGKSRFNFKELSPQRQKEISRDIENLKERIIPILKQYKVKKAGLFGSYVRGEVADNSDIDILVKMNNDTDYEEFINLQETLEKVLGKKVDLGKYKLIKPLLKEKILREQIEIFKNSSL